MTVIPTMHIQPKPHATYLCRSNYLWMTMLSRLLLALTARHIMESVVSQLMTPQHGVMTGAAFCS